MAHSRTADMADVVRQADIVVGAAPALVGGIVSATIATAMLIREIRERRQPVVTDAAIAPAARTTRRS